MKFLVQNDEDTLDIERMLVLEQLKRSKYVHSYEERKLKELKTIENIESGMIPIGTIDYVALYLNKTQGFTLEKPIEVPKYLRKEEFLHRKYEIVTWDRIPRSGRYFIKNVSRLKHFSYCGDLGLFIQEDMFEKPVREFDASLRLSKDDLYLVSEEVRPLSEYRVYVIGNRIEAISHYDGDPTIFPDVKVIQNAVTMIEYNEKYLKSYTVDVMVTPRGTSIIEIHNFTSCGLYTTLFGTNLLGAYIDGINYLLQDNKSIEV